MGLIRISQQQGRVPITVFHLEDRVDLANFAELERAATQAYDTGMRDLVVDLSQTAALTSIGVRALVVMHKLLSQDNGRHLKVACASAEIRDMLDVSGITQYIQIYDTVEDAVKSF